MNDYIGREVEYYYFDNGEVELPQIMIAETTNKDETVCIPAEDIVEFKNYKFVYENGRRTVTKTVKPGAALIYNGINMGNYTPDMFDFETGDVTLIKSRHSSQIDIIVVNSYTSYYIAELNRNDMILFGKTTADADAKSFDTLADTAEEYKVRVYWQNGGKASLNELSRGMVCDIAQNGKCIKIIIPTDNIYAVTVTGVGERDGNHSLRDTENRSFEFLQSYYDTLGYKKPVIGESYTIYLNSFGKIVWIDVGQSEKNSDIHYLISTADDEDENGAYVKLLNSNGVISRYHVVLNTKVKNQENEAIKFKSGMSLEAILDSYSGVVRVKFNEENEVTEIELPQKRETTERSGRLGAFEENEKVYWCGQGTEKHFENVMLSSKAVLFRINEAATEDSDKYSIITQNILKSGNTYSIKAYNYDSESIVSDCVVIKGGLALPIDDNNKTMYIIKSINEALNDEDESVIEIECTGIAANAKPVEARLRLKSGTTAHAETFFDPNAKILLKKGDIVYCEIENDYVTRIALIYRIYNEVGESNLYGTSGAYTPTLSNATNPYVVSSTGTIDTNVNNVTKLRPALTRFFAGYVYKLEQDKYLTYTSMPLNSGTMFDRKNLDSKYLAETVILPKNYVVVDVYGDKMEIQNGDVGAIKTYYNSGTARSEVFILTRYGVPWQLVFVNRR